MYIAHGFLQSLVTFAEYFLAGENALIWLLTYLDFSLRQFLNFFNFLDGCIDDKNTGLQPYIYTVL